MKAQQNILYVPCFMYESSRNLYKSFEKHLYCDLLQGSIRVKPVKVGTI